MAFRSSYKSGWYGESHRHYLAAKGIRTGRAYNAYYASNLSEEQLRKLTGAKEELARYREKLVAEGRLAKVEITDSDAYEENLNLLKGLMPEPPRVAQKSPIEIRAGWAAKRREREQAAEEVVQRRINEAVAAALKAAGERAAKSEEERTKAEGARAKAEADAQEEGVIRYERSPEEIEIAREELETRPRQFIVEPDAEVEAVVQRKQDLLRLL